MTNNQDRHLQTQKKPYRKPVLVQIPLRPEEAVLGNCKTAGTAGPVSGSNCSPVGNCSSIGT
jgi:hypothetical protein